MSKIIHDDEGRMYAEFKDAQGAHCVISSGKKAVFENRSPPEPGLFINRNSFSVVALKRDMVKELLPLLQSFVDKGELE